MYKELEIEIENRKIMYLVSQKKRGAFGGL